jgi:AMMECR1 domain-containing protein
LQYREYDATFLPEVAAEENWDIPTTLMYLINKAGYKKKPD